MNRRTLIWIVVVWVLITLYNYFYMNFFFLAFLWMGLSLLLLIITIIQIIKLFQERQSISSLRVQKVVVFTVLFLLTYYHSFTNSIIEKADWKLFYNKRIEVVEMVKSGQLKPNLSWNGVVCEVPFEFPIISNGGNDIVIGSNEENGMITVKFWIFRNFFDSPSTYFIYTKDSTRIAYIETKILITPN